MLTIIKPGNIKSVYTKITRVENVLDISPTGHFKIAFVQNEDCVDVWRLDGIGAEEQLAGYYRSEQEWVMNSRGNFKTGEVRVIDSPILTSKG